MPLTETTAQRTFKFLWLNEKGQQAGMLRKRGSFDGQQLTLDESEIPVESILATHAADGKLALVVVVADEEAPFAQLMIQPRQAVLADQLKQELDRARSRLHAAQQKRSLEEQHQGHLYHEETCRFCESTIPLGKMPLTPQVFCPYCDRLFTLKPNEELLDAEEYLRVCGDCGMYSNPQKFTLFYFYFLLVVYGFWSKPLWRCPACMRRDAWKMFFGNLPFLLGVPLACRHIWRSYHGGISRGPYRHLHRANVRAQSGDLSSALADYQAILDEVPHSAGVKYNLAMALDKQGETDRALAMYELALEDCANYSPAWQHLRQLYQRQGETRKLKALDAIWGESEEPEHPDARAISE